MTCKIWKTRLNGHEDLDTLDRTIQNLQTVTNEKFYRTAVTLNNHHLTIEMLTKEIIANTKVLRKYMGFMIHTANHSLTLF